VTQGIVGIVALRPLNKGLQQPALNPQRSPLTQVEDWQCQTRLKLVTELVGVFAISPGTSATERKRHLWTQNMPSTD